MRISELSERSGIALATIKYYLREGLLPPGERTGPNQASYGEQHLRRLRLVRALIEVGGLPVATVGEVLAAVDSPDLPMFSLLGVVQDSITAPPPPATDDEWDRASATVRAEMDRRGWDPKPSADSISTLTSVLVRLAQLGYEDWGTTVLPRYFDGVRVIADIDVATALAAGGRDDIIDAVVVLTVLGDTAIAAIRRIAQAQVSLELLKNRPE
ncbi:MerR family transcriptional regulator [Nocardia neocaledoniensis NBRC 108232]|uniref:MerR-like DNA binding protein n=1 Tax=Nocardia neocaledoniensis TaxID=236511 RepID=A0A317N5T4_9NOCA|nr:MerR family transcriptional regulator [Nocardia neocaledoniensis]PWV70681.1 MerR-like DNA binding protein [Nocardia neocaledoniensis]GEM32337.1 MerR family transcriptional regulator [Nocardia neocaledoniensis NBRC 108232]